MDQETNVLTEETALPASLTEETALPASEHFLRTMPSMPEHFEGKGIVICGGGDTYFTSAWISINLLRHLGCTLPIQLWYLGPRELDHIMADLVAPFGVTCIDSWEIRKEHPVRILNGWELKPYALIHCPFQEVLLLDADNLAVVNPEFLFTTPQYQEHGALFWPDYGRLPETHAIWRLCGVPYQDEPEFESGQLLVDKKRCWPALCLTMWYNEHSDFYYDHIHGDKETFHLAFRKLKQPYALPEQSASWHAGILSQRDFEGRPLFEHQVKWNYNSGNGNDFLTHAALCQRYLEELRLKWDGQISLP